MVVSGVFVITDDDDVDTDGDGDVYLEPYEMESLTWYRRTICAPVSRIYREEGVAAFYKGLGVASLRMLPVGGISRGTYEALQMAITALDDQLLKMKQISELRALTQSS